MLRLFFATYATYIIRIFLLGEIVRAVFMYLCFFFNSFTLGFAEDSYKQGIMRSMKHVFVEYPSRIRLRHGTENTYLLKGDSRDLDKVSVRQEGDKLIIGRKNIAAREDYLHLIEIELETSEIKSVGLLGNTQLECFAIPFQELTLEGKGDTQIKGSLEGKALTLHLEGHSQLTLSGTSRSISLFVAGNFNTDLSFVETQTLEIEAMGHGKIFAKAAELLDVDLQGNIECIYYGKPKQIKQVISGKSALISK